jgi:oligoribonuclease NrnB/cAMP/cGMP phosphodiesterase (DHH superfamily)
MKQIYLFTHTDLDGVACAILLHKFISNYRNDYILNTQFCNYNDIDKKVLDLINCNNVEDGSIMYITDISVSKETAITLDNYHYDHNIDLHLLDHHKTALYLNKYNWADVCIDHNTKGAEYLTCGASLLAEKLYVNTNWAPDAVKRFVSTVRLWDTFEFKKLTDDNNYKYAAKALNYLFMNMDREEFMYQMETDYLADDSTLFPLFTLEHTKIIKAAFDAEDRAYNDAIYNMICKKIDGLNVGIYFGNSYVSVVCSRICEENRNLDYVICINMKRFTLEFRTIKDSIHLGTDIAYRFGGGGHDKAAGASLTKETINKIIDVIISQKE